MINLSMIAAMGQNRVIGKDNDLPWKLPAEQQYFKQVTMGHTVVSGRKNHEAMGTLKGRRNIVLTRDTDYSSEDCEIIHMPEALWAKLQSDRLERKTEQEVFIIGGEQIYRIYLPYATKLYITVIEEHFEGDTYFPEINLKEWKLISEKPGQTDANNPYRYTYHIYERILSNDQL